MCRKRAKDKIMRRRVVIQGAWNQKRNRSLTLHVISRSLCQEEFNNTTAFSTWEAGDEDNGCSRNDLGWSFDLQHGSSGSGAGHCGGDSRPSPRKRKDATRGGGRKTVPLEWQVLMMTSPTARAKLKGHRTFSHLELIINMKVWNLWKRSSLITLRRNAARHSLEKAEEGSLQQ